MILGICSFEFLNPNHTYPSLNLSMTEWTYIWTIKQWRLLPIKINLWSLLLLLHTSIECITNTLGDEMFTLLFILTVCMPWIPWIASGQSKCYTDFCKLYSIYIARFFRKTYYSVLSSKRTEIFGQIPRNNQFEW